MAPDLIHQNQSNTDAIQSRIDADATLPKPWTLDPHAAPWTLDPGPCTLRDAVQRGGSVLDLFGERALAQLGYDEVQRLALPIRPDSSVALSPGVRISPGVVFIMNTIPPQDIGAVCII